MSIDLTGRVTFPMFRAKPKADSAVELVPIGS
jgi:hypothetical protein